MIEPYDDTLDVLGLKYVLANVEVDTNGPISMPHRNYFTCQWLLNGHW